MHTAVSKTIRIGVSNWNWIYPRRWISSRITCYRLRWYYIKTSTHSEYIDWVTPNGVRDPHSGSEYHGLNGDIIGNVSLHRRILYIS